MHARSDAYRITQCDLCDMCITFPGLVKFLAVEFVPDASPNPNLVIGAIVISHKHAYALLGTIAERS